MHSYLAFILYVRERDIKDCTAIERLVKTKVDEGNYDFFPVQRCLAIRGGE
jgi:hypothetical protein